MTASANPMATSLTMPRGRQWWILGAVGTSMFLGTLDSSIVNIALPVLVQELDTNFVTGQWVVLAYLLTVTALLMVMGRLGDLQGKKVVFLTGQVVFTLGSVLCGLATSIGFLVGFRVLQGLGAAMISSLGIAILTETWPAQERGKALGISNAFLTLGVVAGPVLGGLLLEYLSWQWIFYVNIPIAVGGFLICLRFLPPMVQEQASRRFDFPGALWTGIGLTAFCLLLTLSQDQSLPLPGMLLLGLVAVVSLGLFIQRERTCALPMVDLAIFRIRPFRRGLTIQVAVFITLMGVILLLPFYLVQVRGFPMAWVGLISAAVPLVMTPVAPVAGILSDRIGTLSLILLGLAGIALGYLTASTLDLDTHPWGYVVRLLPLGVGVSLFTAANTRNIMSAAPRHQLGVASGIFNMMRTMSHVISIPLLGTVMALRILHYHDARIDLSLAPPEPFVQALQDQFLMCAGLVLAALVYAWLGRDAHQSTPASRDGS